MNYLKHILWFSCFLNLFSSPHAGQLGNWQYTNSLNISRSDNTAVLSQNTIIYTLGGFAYTDTPYPVERATILPNGTLSNWVIDSSPMILPRDLALSLCTNGFIYAIGGVGTISYSTTIERAPINTNGTLGTWSTIGFTPTKISSASIATYKQFCYIIGGYPGSSTIYWTTLNPDGSLGTWTQTTAKLLTGRFAHSSIVINTSLYVVDGYSTNGNTNPGFLVERAVFFPNGQLSAFTTISGTHALHSGFGLFFDEIYLNIIEGYDGGDFNYHSERAIVNSDGSLGTWIPAPYLQTERQQFGFVQTTTGCYVIGGYGGYLNSVEYAPILPPAGIDINTWQPLDSP